MILRQAQDERAFGDAFAARLIAKARRLGLARAEALIAERSGRGPERWRKARLLWPLLGGDA